MFYWSLNKVLLFEINALVELSIYSDGSFVLTYVYFNVNKKDCFIIWSPESQISHWNHKTKVLDLGIGDNILCHCFFERFLIIPMWSVCTYT